MHFDNSLTILTTGAQCKQKGFTPIFILVGILVIAVVGGVLYLNRLSQKTTSPSPVYTSSSPQPAPDVTVYTEATRSANWKTYINKDHQFSISIPTGMTFYDGVLIYDKIYDQKSWEFYWTSPPRESIKSFKDNTLDYGMVDAELSAKQYYYIRIVIIENTKLHVGQDLSLTEENLYKRKSTETGDIVSKTNFLGRFSVKSVSPNLEEPEVSDVSVKYNILDNKRLITLQGMSYDSSFKSVEDLDQTLSTFKFLE